MNRKPYPSDVSDDEWAFAAPYLSLMREDAPQREYSLREVFNGLRLIIRTGVQWRMMPNDLPPWASVYQQAQRWLKAGVFEAMVHDLRELLRLAKGRSEQPSASIFDYERLLDTLKGLHFLAFAVLMLKRFVNQVLPAKAVSA
jgi:transposase